jgi:hypothetical protein
MARMQQSKSGKRYKNVQMITRKEYKQMLDVMRVSKRFPLYSQELNFRNKPKSDSEK